MKKRRKLQKKRKSAKKKNRKSEKKERNELWITIVIHNCMRLQVQ